MRADIDKIIRVAKKVANDECGYTQEDLIEELNKFRNKNCCLIHQTVTLHSDEWDLVTNSLDFGDPDSPGVSISRKIKEQL